jgi:hypothetical protein
MHSKEMGMIRKLLVIVFLVFVSGKIDAQNMRKFIKVKVAEASITAGFGLYDNPVWGVGPSIHYMLGLGHNSQKFKIGIGMREFSYFAKRREYETSNQDYVQKLTNGTDSVFVDKMQSNFLNGYLALRYKIKRGIELGANIDIGGITFGGTKKGQFHSYELTLGKKLPVNLKPYGYNLNMFGQKGTWGTSFSEVYMQFRAGNHMSYRVSVNKFLNEVESLNYVTGNGYRFSNNGYTIMGSLVFNIRQLKSERDETNFFKKSRVR